MWGYLAMRWIQKIVVNGRSAQVTIPRGLLFRLDVRPGEFIELTHNDNEDSFLVRVWRVRENAQLQSPGLIPERPEPLRR